ncbi:MAG: trypsin-like peptidase domain-containing protein [bacterium]|nr:trypsin-like peptidase domain-containing protein [bacterium]
MDESQQLTVYKYPRKSIIITMIFLAVISLGFGFFGGLVGGIVGFTQGGSIASYFGIETPNGLVQNVTQETRMVQEDSATIDVVKQASPSVVSILVKKEVTAPSANNPFFSSPFGNFFQIPLPTEPRNPAPQEDTPIEKQTIGEGSGFIISADGMILTNHHVVSDTSADYVVVTNDGTEYPAKILATDSLNDVAVIKIEATDVVPLEFADEDAVEIGQTVIAIGNTLGEFRNTVTRGVVSGINRVVQASGNNGEVGTIYEAIQTDAAINHGNSGGPLLNLAGKVVGMNTAVSRSGQSVGFAIPSSIMKRDLESVRAHGKIVRPWLGVRYQMVDEEYVKKNNLPNSYGAVIVGDPTKKERGVVSGSPAEKAGLAEDDIILEVDGKKINDENALAHVLSLYEPNTEVTLKVFSRGKEKDIKVTLGEFDDSLVK